MTFFKRCHCNANVHGSWCHQSLPAPHSHVKINIEGSNKADRGEQRDEAVSCLLEMYGDGSVGVKVERTKSH